MRAETFDVAGDGLFNVSHCLIARLALRNAPWQRRHLGDEHTVLILFNQHAELHLLASFGNNQSAVSIARFVRPGGCKYRIHSQRRRAPNDATLTFLCELGPKEYAITGADGYELSDRWKEALLTKKMIRELWDRIECQEIGGAARTA